MPTLHVFNPEHDMALARNNPFFNAPKAARITREAFGHLPALWAVEGDFVLVDDVAHAYEKLKEEKHECQGVKFVSLKELYKIDKSVFPTRISPWGWDVSIVHALAKADKRLVGLMPSEGELEYIRMASSRVFAAENILPELRKRGEEYVGEMEVFRGSVEELREKLRNTGGCVLKSPWSCSGRGVRMVTSPPVDNLLGWARNVLEEQGAIMIEPLYDKVIDFGMEFYAHKDTGVEYLGLSVFEAANGAYLGNMVASEETKMKTITRYMLESSLVKLKEEIKQIASSLFLNRYDGPFGVDMMIVNTSEGLRVHPCVELNLRRTMGHVAIERYAAQCRS